MKELKFRVWCTDGNEWEKHGVTIGENGQLLHMGKGYVTPLRSDTHIIEYSTGLKDINGKEVYEGDIVEVTSVMDEVYRAEVVYDHMQWELYDIEGGDPESLYNQAIHCEKTLEVIGNIYDNPELLAKEEAP